MPKTKHDAPETHQPSGLLDTIEAGKLTLVVRAGHDLASFPTEDGLEREAYTHLQVEANRLKEVPEGFRIYFGDDGIARCLAAPVLADLIAAVIVQSTEVVG